MERKDGRTCDGCGRYFPYSGGGNFPGLMGCTDEALEWPRTGHRQVHLCHPCLALSLEFLQAQTRREEPPEDPEKVVRFDVFYKESYNWLVIYPHFRMNTITAVSILCEGETFETSGWRAFEDTSEGAYMLHVRTPANMPAKQGMCRVIVRYIP